MGVFGFGNEKFQCHFYVSYFNREAGCACEMWNKTIKLFSLYDICEPFAAHSVKNQFEMVHFDRMTEGKRC